MLSIKMDRFVRCSANKNRAEKRPYLYITNRYVVVVVLIKTYKRMVYFHWKTRPFLWPLPRPRMHFSIRYSTLYPVCLLWIWAIWVSQNTKHSLPRLYSIHSINFHSSIHFTSISYWTRFFFSFRSPIPIRINATTTKNESEKKQCIRHNSFSTERIGWAVLCSTVKRMMCGY